MAVGDKNLSRNGCISTSAQAGKCLSPFCLCPDCVGRAPTRARTWRMSRSRPYHVTRVPDRASCADVPYIGCVKESEQSPTTPACPFLPRPPCQIPHHRLRRTSYLSRTSIGKLAKLWQSLKKSKKNSGKLGTNLPSQRPPVNLQTTPALQRPRARLMLPNTNTQSIHPNS
jgi:hypothetical protein